MQMRYYSRYDTVRWIRVVVLYVRGKRSVVTLDQSPVVSVSRYAAARGEVSICHA